MVAYQQCFNIKYAILLMKRRTLKETLLSQTNCNIVEDDLAYEVCKKTLESSNFQPKEVAKLFSIEATVSLVNIK